MRTSRRRFSGPDVAYRLLQHNTTCEHTLELCTLARPGSLYERSFALPVWRASTLEVRTSYAPPFGNRARWAASYEIPRQRLTPLPIVRRRRRIPQVERTRAKDPLSRAPLLQALSDTLSVIDACHGSLKTLPPHARQPRLSFPQRPAKGAAFQRAGVPSTVRHRPRDRQQSLPIGPT